MEKYASEYENYFEEETMKEKEQGNSIIIAGKPFEVYNQNILNLLQKYDQIEIKVADRYAERAIYIIRQWEAVGMIPEKNKINPEGKILFFKTEEDIILRDNKKYKEQVNKITLTKIPELFRYTHN